MTLGISMTLPNDEHVLFSTHPNLKSYVHATSASKLQGHISLPLLITCSPIDRNRELNLESFSKRKYVVVVNEKEFQQEYILVDVSREPIVPLTLLPPRSVVPSFSHIYIYIYNQKECLITHHDILPASGICDSDELGLFPSPRLHSWLPTIPQDITPHSDSNSFHVSSRSFDHRASRSFCDAFVVLQSPREVIQG